MITFAIDFNGMNTRTKFIYVAILTLVSHAAIGQINFFTNSETDSVSKNFYSRNKTATVLAMSNAPSWQYGVAFFLHNAENRISYFVEAKSNFRNRYVINGVECYGEGTRQKQVAFSSSMVNVGLARGFTRNLFVYGGVGIEIMNTEFNNNTNDNYRYTVPNQGVWFNAVAGAMYVANNNLSGLIGLNFYDRSISFGIGYTW